MKKSIVLLLTLILVFTVGCSNVKDTKDSRYYLYAGQSDHWFANYTVSEVNSSYFESLYIQYLFDRSKVPDKTEEIGKIEYLLEGNSMKLQSSYPHALTGIGNLHSATETNSEVINMVFDEEITLTVTWKGQSETLKLKKILND